MAATGAGTELGAVRAAQHTSMLAQVIATQAQHTGHAGAAHGNAGSDSAVSS
jgi:hypothetical protein